MPASPAVGRQAEDGLWTHLLGQPATSEGAPPRRRAGRKEEQVAATSFPAISGVFAPGVAHEHIVLDSTRRFEFIDLTPRIAEIVRRAGLLHGLVSVQTRHTTTAILVNEHEPRLLEDIRERLELWAPESAGYRHDDLRLRTVNLTAEERPNGHAHARAVVLRTSESVHVVDGLLQLGRWQRVFFLELDGARRRTVSVLAVGACRTAPAAPRRQPRAARERGTRR